MVLSSKTARRENRSRYYNSPVPSNRWVGAGGGTEADVERGAEEGTKISECLDDSPCVGIEGILAGGAPESPKAMVALVDLVVGPGDAVGAAALEVDPGVGTESVRAAFARRQDLRASRGSPVAVVDSTRGLASVPTSLKGIGSR